MASHNTSKYHANTIVIFTAMMQDYPAFVEARDNSNEAPDTWAYTLTMPGWGPIFANEADLRPMTFEEFASFTHPKTGGWMVGKTRGWMAVVIHALSLLGIVAGIAQAAMGNIAALSVTGISLAVLVLFWVYTYRNFKGTTV